jgi:hypothetical protein
VEHEEDWLVLLGIDLLLDVLLVLLEELWSELGQVSKSLKSPAYQIKYLDVSWLVHAVDVTETGGDGEIGRDSREALVDLVDVLRLGVQAVVVNVLVVDTVLLTTSDTDLHLKPLLHGGYDMSVS